MVKFCTESTMGRDMPSTSYEHPGFLRDCIIKENRIRDKWNETYGKQFSEARWNKQLCQGNSTEDQPVASQSREISSSQVDSLRNDQRQEHRSLLAPSTQVISPRKNHEQELHYGRCLYESPRYMQPHGERAAEKHQTKYESGEIPSSQVVLLREDQMHGSQRSPSRKDYRKELQYGQSLYGSSSGQVIPSKNDNRKGLQYGQSLYGSPRYMQHQGERAAKNQQVKSDKRHEIQIVSAPEYHQGMRSRHPVTGKWTDCDCSILGSSKQPAGQDEMTVPYSGYGKVIRQTPENRNVLQYREPIYFKNLTSLEDQVPFLQQIRPGVDPNDWRPDFHRQHIPTCKKCYTYPCECAGESYGPAENLTQWDKNCPDNPRTRDMGLCGIELRHYISSKQPRGLTSTDKIWHCGVKVGNIGEHHSGSVWNLKRSSVKFGNDLVKKDKIKQFFERRKED